MPRITTNPYNLTLVIVSPQLAAMKHLLSALCACLTLGSLAAQTAQVPPTPPPAEDATFRNPLFQEGPGAPTPAATGLEGNPEPPANDSAVGADSGGQPTVLRLDLDEETPVPVPTSMIRTTTVVFPFPIEDLHGTGFTPNPAKIRGDFFVAARPGKNYLSITPLVEGVRRNLNIIANGKVYSLDVYPANPKGAAAFSVLLRAGAPKALPAAGPRSEPALAPGSQPTTGAGPEVTRSLVKPPATGKQAGAARVLGVMDSMKLLAGIGDKVAAKKAADLMPGVQFVARSQAQIEKETQDLQGLKVSVTHVLRNSQLDAVAFAILVTNTTKAGVSIDRQSFTVRVADPTSGPSYEAVTADVDAVIAPGSTKRAFFVVVGGAVQGSRNNLDPEKNRFYISCATAPAPSKVAKTP